MNVHTNVQARWTADMQDGEFDHLYDLLFVTSGIFLHLIAFEVVVAANGEQRAARKGWENVLEFLQEEACGSVETFKYTLDGEERPRRFTCYATPFQD